MATFPVNTYQFDPVTNDWQVVAINSPTATQVFNQVYVAGENLNSHTPIVLIAGLAYAMNNLNPLHRFAFIGFSKTSSLTGGDLTVETIKIDLAGWGLTPNQTYMAGANGALITVNNTAGSFTKIVGFAQSPTSMLIVKDYSSINKN